MSYRSMLTDKCDIFLSKNRDWNYGYGIQGENKQQYYDKEPDYLQVPCYFTPAGSGRGAIIQNEPNAVVYESFLVHFLIGTDVKVNTKIRKDGVFYKLQIPRSIRNHHIEVIAVREESL